MPDQEKPRVTLPWPLPWRVTFSARVTSFNGDEYDLEADRGHFRWEATVSASDCDFDPPDYDAEVEVVLEPMTGVRR